MPEPCFSILVTASISALVLIVEHYAPFVKFLTGHDRLSPVGNYIIGSLAMFVPFTLLILYWDGLNKPLSTTIIAYALWTIALVSGLVVWGCYKADKHNEQAVKLEETELRENHLRDTLKGGNHEPNL